MEFSIGAAVVGAIIGIIATTINKKLGAIIAFAGFLPLIITLFSGLSSMSNSNPVVAGQIAANTTSKIANQGAGMLFDEMIAVIVGSFVAAGLAIFAVIRHLFNSI
jgi:uncharacterized membrane protein YeaQ/YmgE (transglycosylase-associated protein family)